MAKAAGFFELTAEQRALCRPEQLQVWDLRKSGLGVRATANALGIGCSTVYEACSRIRRIGTPDQMAELGERWYGRVKNAKVRLPDAPRRWENLQPIVFERLCAEETEREEREGTRMVGMKLQDFQRCTHCGLRGHLPEACDLSEVRMGLLERRAWRGVDLGEP